MSSQWYYKKSGENFGPVTTTQLKHLATSMQILPKDLIWKDEVVGWTRADTVVGLFAPAAAAETLSPSRALLIGMSARLQSPELSPAIAVSPAEATNQASNDSLTTKLADCGVKQIAYGFKYGVSGFRSYDGPVLADDKCIYMVVGDNRFFGSNVAVGTTCSSPTEIIVRSICALVLKGVLSTVGNSLRHPYAVSFCDLPENTRSQEAFGNLKPAANVIVIAYAKVKSVTRSRWIGRRFAVETDQATFKFDLSNSEAIAAHVLFAQYGLFAKPNSTRSQDDSGGRTAASNSSWPTPDQITNIYRALLLPTVTPMVRAARQTRISAGATIKRAGWGNIIWYCVGLVAIYVYWCAAAFAGMAAARNMNIVPAVLYMGVPLLIIYGAVRLFRLRALGSGFLSGFATIGFVSAAGTITVLCGVDDKAAAYLCWTAALLIVFPAITWFQFRAISPDASLDGHSSNDVATRTRAENRSVDDETRSSRQTRSSADALHIAENNLAKPTYKSAHFNRMVMLAIAATVLAAFLAVHRRATNHRPTKAVNALHLNISADSKITPASNSATSKAALDARAMTEMGVRYFNGDDGIARDYQQAVACIRKGAEGGDTRAYYCLGLAYNLGHGVDQDYGLAVGWFKKGADAGDANAMFCLGVCYAKAQGVPQEFQQAMAWSTKAADAGNATAMSEIGALYENGQGVAQDTAEALVWFHKAADLGDEQSKQIIVGLERLEQNKSCPEPTGLARLGFTRDRCLICGEERTTDSKATYSDSRGFGLCEECGSQYQSFKQVLTLGIQTGSIPSEADELLVNQFTDKLQSAQNPAAASLTPLFTFGQFATPAWNTLTAGR